MIAREHCVPGAVRVTVHSSAGQNLLSPAIGTDHVILESGPGGLVSGVS